jgi:hypothetical protein
MLRFARRTVCPEPAFGSSLVGLSVSPGRPALLAEGECRTLPAAIACAEAVNWLVLTRPQLYRL